ncbi:hypothetical protein GF322_00700 [Candidatus Dependentiae bacterium]|nr:hypothetical protein [Candidatus Dependentiae bacterium]
MKQLEELQAKILNIVNKNKELSEENSLLKLENEKLQERVSAMEETMLNKDVNSETLQNEKTAIKNSIEDLLNNLSSLEESKEETSQSN